ncbi:MAG: 5-oxoprolinase subunit B family protein [Solirubrobacteraceae bacterium]
MTPELAVRPVGDRGFLVEVGDNRRVHRLAAAVRDRYGDELEDAVPGEETLLLCWRDDPPGRAELTAALGSLTLDGEDVVGSPDGVRIEVRYDGADLEAVAEALGVDVETVVDLHSRREYLVAFMGFAPGFAYMTGADPRLHLPRRDEPRPRVPAGSVAIATAYTAVYPTSAPGGWHLLGHTDAVLFDPDRDPPTLLAAGARVTFVPA